MGESVKEVKLCLLEHAAKHEMRNVVKHILNDKTILEHLLKKFAAQEEDPVFLFLLLLEHLRDSLQKFKVPDISNAFLCNRERLSMVIDVLNVTYQQKHFIDFFAFMKLLKLLKLLVLFRMIYENADSHDVCGALNLHFPHWCTGSKEKFLQVYGTENEQYADNIKETNSETRKFILKLLLNNKLRESYLKTNYSADVQKMVQKSIILLDLVIGVVRNLTGLSAVEQIFSSNDDISPSNDPAVQIILEYLKPEATENDLLELLNILDFPEFQGDNADISFGSPIDIQTFITPTESNVLCEQLKLSVLDDDSPPLSGDDLDVSLSTTVQKQYGPLGLGPPSGKKPTVEEASEIQIVQQHRQLVLDSEDEEMS